MLQKMQIYTIIIYFLIKFYHKKWYIKWGSKMRVFHANWSSVILKSCVAVLINDIFTNSIEESILSFSIFEIFHYRYYDFKSCR